jgi:tetratricopeptide (TPR) repeat protein
MTYIEEALAHGMARHKAGQLLEAQTVYESLLSLSHDKKINGAVLGHLADLHLRSNRFGEARQAAGRALQLDQSNGTALLAGVQAERRSGKAERGLTLLKVHSSHHLPPSLLHEMGMCWHSLEQYRKAFLCFKEAKRRISFEDLDVNRQLLTKFMEHQANRFSTIASHTWTPTPDLDRPNPVFLIGFNESGVMELGQMLDEHPGFGLAPETPAMDAARRGLGVNDPDGLHTMTEDAIRDARDRYFRVIDAHVAKDAIPVDAMPLNALSLALIHRLFPEALILRSMRHPCEAVLRTFIKPYALNPVTCHYDRLERTATTLMATTSVSTTIEGALSMTVHNLQIEAFLCSPQETVSAIASSQGLDGSIDIATPPTSPVNQWPKYQAEMSRWLKPLESLADAAGYPAK